MRIIRHERSGTRDPSFWSARILDRRGEHAHAPIKFGPVLLIVAQNNSLVGAGHDANHNRPGDDVAIASERPLCLLLDRTFQMDPVVLRMGRRVFVNYPYPGGHVRNDGIEGAHGEPENCHPLEQTLRLVVVAARTHVRDVQKGRVRTASVWLSGCLVELSGYE